MPKCHVVPLLSPGSRRGGTLSRGRIVKGLLIGGKPTVRLALMGFVFELVVNGREVTATTEDEFALLCDVIRDSLQLMGTKIGCREGSCGSCNVLVDGVLTRSCLILAAQSQGRAITTIEGLVDRPSASLLQEALVDRGGVQCGFCTPGIVMSLYELLERNSSPEREEMIQVLNGNLCRCTGYTKILESMESLQEQR